MSLRAEKPRSVRESPWKPPSPAAIETPATLRSASRSVVLACSFMSSWGTTLIVCGVSSSGCVNFGEMSRGASPVTTISSDASSVSSAEPAEVNRKPTLVPTRSCLSATSTDMTPVTPGEGIWRRPASGTLTLTPEAARYASSTAPRGPGAISNRLTGSVAGAAAPLAAPATVSAASARAVGLTTA